MSNDRPFYGWKLVGALSAMDFLNLGFPFYIGAVINPYMLQHIAMSRGTYGFGFTLLNLFVGLPSTLVAISIVKRGIRATYVIGSTSVCLGSLFLAFGTSKPWQYLLGFGVINGIGVCFGDIICGSTAAARWFERYRGRAVGLVLSGSGVCGFVMAPLIDKLLRASGGNWHLGWQIVAAGAVLSGIIALLFVKERPEDLGQLPDGGVKDSGGAPQKHAPSALVTHYEWTSGEAYRTSSYWLVVFAGLAAQFPFFLFIAHWVEHLTGVGITPAKASWGISLLTLGTLGGRWLGGLLMDYLNARLVFVLGASLYFISSYLAFTSNAEALKLAYVASALQGIAYGWTYSCTNTMIGHYYGPKAYPKLSGMFIFLTSAIASPAGLVGGMIFDRYGSYVKSFELDAVLAAIGIVAVVFAAMPTPRETVAIRVAEPGVASAS